MLFLPVRRFASFLLKTEMWNYALLAFILQLFCISWHVTAIPVGHWGVCRAKHVSLSM